MPTRFAPLFDFDLVSRPRTVPVASAVSVGAPMDAVRTEDALELRFDLPGVRPESVDLSVEQHVLTLTAERSDDVPGEAKVLVRERRHGWVKRQLRLSSSLDTSRVEARYDNGVLTVRIPVAEAAQPHKVTIEVGSGEIVEAAAIDERSEN